MLRSGFRLRAPEAGGRHRPLGLYVGKGGAMRRWLREQFPDEFSWRLFVVIQCGALLAFGYLLISEDSDGRPLIRLRYKNIYEKVEPDPAAVEAARARCSHVSDDPNHPDARMPLISDPFEPEKRLSPRELCFQRERPPSQRVIGSEFAGFRRLNGLVLLALMGALLGPFTAFRVTLWVLAGLRTR